METIVIVCGAGASSTFLAHRMNRDAKAAGLQFSVRAATLDDYLRQVHAGDVLLVGPQLASRFDEIRASAAAAGACAALLPETIFGANGAGAALRIAADLQGEHHG